MAISYTPQKTGSSYRVTVASPIDVRTVVDSIEDLTNNSISYMYTGLIVNVKCTGDLYILTTHPRLANKIDSWKKVGVDIDLSEYVTKNILADYASQSDLKTYVKTDDVIEYVELNGDFVKSDEITNFREAGDLAEYVSIDSLDEILTEKGLDDFVSQSDLTMYVSREELTEYVTSSDLDNRLASIKIPENVSAFLNDAGYLTETDLPDFLLASDLDGYVKTEDLEAYIPKTELDKLATKSDLEGYVKTSDAAEFLTASDLDNFATIDKIPTVGSFPADADIEASDKAIDGYATVKNVMDYVNTLLEKKKEEENRIRYAYITGYALDGTPTDITVFNKFLLNDSGDTEFEIYAPQEIGAYANNGDDLPSIKLTVDIPSDYSIKSAYQWNPITSEYSLLTGNLAFGQNPRYTSREIDAITYNSYARGPVDSTAMRGVTQYKIIITK